MPIEGARLRCVEADAKLPRRASAVPFLPAELLTLAQRSASRHCEDDVLAALDILEVEGRLELEPRLICPIALLLLPRKSPISGSRTRESCL